jgi:hypothetical protein
MEKSLSAVRLNSEGSRQIVIRRLLLGAGFFLLIGELAVFWYANLMHQAWQNMFASLLSRVR